MLTITHKVLWAIATSMILLSSVYYSIKLKWKQFKIFSLFKEIFNKKNKNSYDALMLTLAGRIGVGSIAGISRRHGDKGYYIIQLSCCYYWFCIDAVFYLVPL